ncbi:hypothetical protein ACQVQT_15170 [Bacillus paranthracis]|uniref:Uncharacterized protein n=3 Tax=Bacillus cereus group TaxID=86661 RepID=A0A5M9GZQ4_9BACI|nr:MULTISPECIES: hypothetical protein [Bacillus]ACJ78694.1 conserved hypothetical protein [Bacillus cereus AH187]ACM13249.1 conserved hypothetical protein [Bacillus cereus Q1]EDZ58497.1 conserved hypothetical protein [Bacillus cereus H3081.97]EJP99211.1 hypothetical protein IAU_00801 [Bacillus cereus IS075]EJQ06178.1 hypothetical protein IC5_01921 [Bacillus cereus AND1407]EJR18167.1 hypothetical protein II7_01303 [Bacillus cereus MSX-A12]EOO88437.1 hypothetical protein IGS_03458 [Bacillus ce
MKTELVPKKKYSIISYICLLIGILCFLFVFITPTRIANAGNIVGDYITVALTVAGIILSIITMTKKTEKKGIAILSFILSSSFFIFWIIAIILLFTGQISFAP